MTLRIIFLFLCIISVGCSKEIASTKPALESIPEKSPLIIKINDVAEFRDALNNSAFITGLGSTNTFKIGLAKLGFLELLHGGTKGVLAFSPTDEGTLESIFIAHPQHTFGFNDSLAETRTEKMRYGSTSMIKHSIKGRSFFSLVGQNTWISSSPSLLAATQIELKNGNHPSATLRKLFDSSNQQKMATLFFDVKQGDRIFGGTLMDSSATAFTHFSDWLALDLNLKPSHFELNGISMANDSVWSIVDLFANTKPNMAVTPTLAPLGTEMIIAYNFDDYTVFARNQQGYLGGINRQDPLFDAVEEIGIIYTGEHKTIIVNTHGSEMLADHLSRTKKNATDYQGNEIFLLGEPNFLNKAFAPLVQNYKANFATIINDAIVFADRREALENIIKNYRTGATFNKSAMFNEVKKGLPEESNLLFVANLNSVKRIFSKHIPVNFNNELTKALRPNYTIASQTTADNGFYHTNLVVANADAKKTVQEITEVFSLKLDTLIATNPQFVTNHLNNTQEIVVQDVANNLYLISNTGKVLWKKQLGATVQGAVKQVDIFKNGRLQLAFTTNDQFMVLDRNGQEVKQFIKSFEGATLNPLAVFDYENKKDYRFVVTQGEKIAMFNSKAETVAGFQYTVAHAPVVAAPKHVRAGKKDFLVFLLADGTVKILDRLGKVRINITEKIDFSENEVYFNNTKFTLTDKKGTLYQIDQFGKLTKRALDLFEDHGLYANENTLVFMNDNKLNINGKEIELELGVYTKPKLVQLHGKTYIGLTDLQHETTYLFDSEGQKIANFPVHGNSLPDLGDADNDKKPDLVVKGGDNYLISYKLP